MTEDKSSATTGAKPKAVLYWKHPYWTAYVNGIYKARHRKYVNLVRYLLKLGYDVDSTP